MKTKINRIVSDWKNVKNKCRTTVNKQYTDNEPSAGFKEKLAISEHSPLRLIEFDWSWFNIPYWVSTEWSRHKWEKFISTQRSDRTGISRDQKPQSAPVNFDGYANAQNMIDTMRKRLCFQASDEARNLAEDFKMVLSDTEPELANVLVPNCIYRCGCPEFKMCKQRFFENFILKHPSIDLTNISERYAAYADDIRKKRKDCN